MKILTFAQYYLPGFKAGGPVRTIHGMADYLSPDLEFWIIATDRDLGDSEPYPNIPIGEWTTLGNARVCTAEGRSRACVL